MFNRTINQYTSPSVLTYILCCLTFIASIFFIQLRKYSDKPLSVVIYGANPSPLSTERRPHIPAITHNQERLRRYYFSRTRRCLVAEEIAAVCHSSAPVQKLGMRHCSFSC